MTIIGNKGGRSTECWNFEMLLLLIVTYFKGVCLTSLVLIVGIGAAVFPIAHRSGMLCKRSGRLGNHITVRYDESHMTHFIASQVLPVAQDF